MTDEEARAKDINTVSCDLEAAIGILHVAKAYWDNQEMNEAGATTGLSQLAQAIQITQQTFLKVQALIRDAPVRLVVAGENDIAAMAAKAQQFGGLRNGG